MSNAMRDIERLATGDGANAVAVVEQLFELAASERASDLHIEPAGDGVKILLRVDGVLRAVAELPPSAHAYVTGRIKVLADLLTYRTDLAQEGRVRFERDGAAVDLRVSVFPAAFGEKIVVRLFDPSERLKTLGQLGLAPGTMGALREALAANDGVILFTGPAGSGKTTTIYACLAALVPVEGGQRSIVTIEDPIEFSIPGVTQTQVNERAGLSFAQSLAHLLRQDPDILMVGEIRDAETARIAVEAGLTGHMVLSTMHCGDCAGAFSRLLDMGIEPYLVTSSVRLVVAQRLLRKLSAETPGGYRERVVVSEALPMSDELRRAILAKADRIEIARVAEATRATNALVEDAIALAERGVTSEAEVKRVFGSINGSA